MNILGAIYYRFLSNFIECARLYKLDLQLFTPPFTANVPKNFTFTIIGIESLGKLRTHYQDNEHRIKVAQERLNSGYYVCFGYIDTATGKIAYTRWICKHEFYSEVLGKRLTFVDNEVLTLDSWTSPEYRNMGLHKNMNLEMLLWLKQHTKVESVFMVIKCFNPHLTKVVRAFGYKPIKTVIRFRNKKDTEC